MKLEELSRIIPPDEGVTNQLGRESTYLQNIRTEPTDLY